MTRRFWLTLVAAVIGGMWLLADPALAGPGGKIASALFTGFWGKVALIALLIVLAPWIVYIVFKSRRATNRAFKDLAFMAQHAPQFEWINIRQRAIDCVQRVHSAWSKEDVSEASRWMTNWYWQNQQIVHIDRWQRDGLVNVCNLRELKSIDPVLFAHRNDGRAHDGSIVVMTVVANMQDYLARRDSGEIVEGVKDYRDVVTTWTLTLTDGEWLVSNIESGSGLHYLEMAKQLQPIEATLMQPHMGLSVFDAKSTR